MQRSKGFCHAVVVSKICYNTVIVLSVVLSDCCKSMNSCQDWAFSNSWLEVGLPAFQLPMFPKCDALPKGDLLDMCLRHPFRPFHFGIPSIQSLPEAGSWERQYPPPVLQYDCIMNHAHPFIAATEKYVSHAEKQRVWSRSCGHQDLERVEVSKIQDIDCIWLCSWLFYICDTLRHYPTAAN